MSRDVLVSTAHVTDPDAVCVCEHPLPGHQVLPAIATRFIVACRVDGCGCLEYRDRRAAER